MYHILRRRPELRKTPRAIGSITITWDFPNALRPRGHPSKPSFGMSFEAQVSGTLKTRHPRRVQPPFHDNSGSWQVTSK